MKVYSLLIFLIALFPATASAEPSLHAHVSLISESKTFRPGTTHQVLFQFQIEKGWHLYWQNPLNPNAPPQIQWELPHGFKAGEITTPQPEKFSAGSLSGYGFTDSLALRVPFYLSQNVVQSSGETIGAQIRWIACKDVCVPGKADLSLTLPVSSKEPVNDAQESSFFWKALLFAFLGGIILNLMPCVFPVLSLKVLSLLSKLRSEKSNIKTHGLFYTAGVLASFLTLGISVAVLHSGGEKLGWGFQLQSPTFVSALCNILFLMALSLLGVFEVSTSWIGIGGQSADRKGYFGSFSSGALATLVATPCTAPFMGTALAFAISQPATLGFWVFTALGLGLATPFLAMCWVPKFAKLLPRPGRWMETFKQFMAFPLLGTVVWLAWIFGLESGVNSLAKLLSGLLLLGMSSWIFGRWQTRSTQVIALFFFTLALGVQFPFSKFSHRVTNSQISDKTHHWKPFSKTLLLELTQSGNPVFLDFTAAWCITCLVNEKIAFTEDVMKTMISLGITPMRADWTHADPEITRLLGEFGRNGIPLYVFYSGRVRSNPRLLPQILTPGIVLKAITDARD